MDRPAVPDAITGPRVVAVARHLDATRVAATADALLAGGIRALELTLNEPEARALEAIEAAAEHAAGLDGALAVGAGTVLTVDAAARAVDAGAAFLVAPHLDLEIVRWALEHGVPMLPGAATPTEVLAAWRAGAAAVKVFPASAVGPAFVREMRGPFPDIPLQPTGGITVENARAYIDAGAIAVGMGSWLFAGGTSQDITSRAAAAVGAVSEGGL